MTDWRKELGDAVGRENPAHEERLRHEDEAKQRMAQHRLMVEHYLTNVLDPAFAAVRAELHKEGMHQRKVETLSHGSQGRGTDRTFEVAALNGRQLRVTFNARYDAEGTYASLDIQRPGNHLSEAVNLSLAQGSPGYMDEEAVCGLLASEYSKLVGTEE